MNKDFLCIQHDLIFNSEEEYKIHKQNTHGTPLPPDVDPSWLPDEEFVQTVQRLENPQPINSNPVIQNESKPVIAGNNVPYPKVNSPVEVKPEKPVELTYRWTGNHCGIPVSTLELDANGKHFSIAFCMVCQKQIELKEVVDLKEKDAKIEPIKQEKWPSTKRTKYKIK